MVTRGSAEFRVGNLVFAYDIDFGTSSSSPLKLSSTCAVYSASDLCPARAEKSTPQAGTLLGRRRHQLSQVGWLTKWCCLRIEFPHRRPSRVGRCPVHHAGFRVSRTCRSADADNLEQLCAWYTGYLQLMTTHPPHSRGGAGIDISWSRWSSRDRKWSERYF